MPAPSTAESQVVRAGQRDFDPVALAVITSRIQGIVRRMTNTLFRTARSSVLNTARDFSCAVVTREHEMLATAESLPIHVMAGPDLVSASLARLHPELHAGDAFLHNSPYHGNSHAGDHCLLVPVVADGEHRFTAIVKAHMADIGNSMPTTLWANARDVYNEGALIFPGVKVQRDYRDVPDVIEMCRTRIRVPDVWYADYIGMVGAARIGERELLGLGEELGWETLHAYTGAWFDYSEEMMAAAIRKMPAGRSVAHNKHDPMPVDGAEDGVPVKVTVDIDPENARVQVDLRENPDCMPCGINLTEATSRTAAMIGVFNSLPTTVPQNAGSFRRLDVLIRENCIAGIPVHPASCSTATTGIADRVANATQRAIAELADGFGMAETGTLTASVADISGKDPRHDDSPFVNLMIIGLTCGAGHARGDGWLVSGEVGDGGLMMRDSTEVDELLYPIVVWADEIVADSGGPGRHRGAPACYVEYGPADTEIEAMWSTDGYVHAALGARGGYPGAPARQFLRRVDGSVEPLPGWGEQVLKPGETVLATSAAGAGYGRPWERSLERVVRDVADGWVSREQAEEAYGVVIRDGGLDAEATAARRAQLAEQSPAPPRLLEVEHRSREIADKLGPYVLGPVPAQ
ncbi:MAG TPA: hydantoinase B/oxoprolinase family protein [Solirubrobacteraceae bacterium]|nr:hydantoinase B/oxoprolinase family protein [Solirubrobacteraceae bacterium]